MKMTFGEQIRIILSRRGLTVEDLAARLDTSKQNLNQRLLRDNFKEKDMYKISEALGCDVSVIVNDKPGKR